MFFQTKKFFKLSFATNEQSCPVAASENSEEFLRNTNFNFRGFARKTRNYFLRGMLFCLCKIDL